MGTTGQATNSLPPPRSVVDGTSGSRMIGTRGRGVMGMRDLNPQGVNNQIQQVGASNSGVIGLGKQPTGFKLENLAMKYDGSIGPGIQAELMSKNMLKTASVRMQPSLGIDVPNPKSKVSFVVIKHVKNQAISKGLEAGNDATLTGVCSSTSFINDEQSCEKEERIDTSSLDEIKKIQQHARAITIQRFKLMKQIKEILKQVRAQYLSEIKVLGDEKAEQVKPSPGKNNRCLFTGSEKAHKAKITKDGELDVVPSVANDLANHLK